MKYLKTQDETFRAKAAAYATADRLAAGVGSNFKVTWKRQGKRLERMIKKHIKQIERLKKGTTL